MMQIGVPLKDEDINCRAKEVLKDFSAKYVLVQSLTVETLFRDHGASVFNKIFKSITDGTLVVFIIHGNLHWSVAFAIRTAVWILYHVDSVEDSEGKCMHEDYVVKLSKIMVESGLFGSRIQVRSAWGHVLQQGDWECGHYAIAAVKSFRLAYQTNGCFREKAFLSTLANNFRHLYNYIDRTHHQTPSHVNRT